VSPLHQPEWRDIPLKTLIQERWRCPFYVDVDTNVAAIGEYHFGNEQAPRFLYMTMSTGIGGGFLVNGKIYRGMAEGHPEVGHQSVNFRCTYPEKVSCECGSPDCLEALVSGNGIQRVYGKAAEHLSECEWAEVSYNLGQGLRNIAALYLPDVVVLGGGVAIGRGEKLVASSGTVLNEYQRFVATPKVRLSYLGYDTTLVGAIAVAMRGLE